MVIVVPIYEEEQAGRLLQHRGRDRRRRQVPGQVPQDPHPALQAGLLGEVLLPARQPRLPRVRDRATRKVGVYICYDRHFPEGARALGLNGAEIVFNPSATVAGLSEYLWKLEQPAHAVANGYFVGAINRVGHEAPWKIGEFYGQSYFCDPRGQDPGRGPARQGRGGGRRPEPRPDRGGARGLAVLPRPPARRLRRRWCSRERTAAKAAAAERAYRNFIGGEWVESTRPKTVAQPEPRRHARRAGPRARSPPPTRRGARWTPPRPPSPPGATRPRPCAGAILFRAWRSWTQEKEDLARLLTREEGKTVKESLGEIQRTINILEYIAAEGRRLGGETLPSELPRNFCYTVRQPLGVVACITPWNFPVAIPVWKIAPALVSGNTVVFKPATLTPETAARRGLDLRAGRRCPRASSTWCSARAAPWATRCVDHAAVRAVSFTGSNEVGAEIYGRGAAAHDPRAVRDGRQEPGGGAGRRRPRPGGRGHGAGRLRLHRPALHRHLAGDRGGGDRRRVRGAAGRARRARCGSATAPRPAWTWARPWTSRSSRPTSRYIEIGQRGRRARCVCGGAPARGRRPRPRLLRRAHRVRPRDDRACGSRRRRSSAPWSR